MKTEIKVGDKVIVITDKYSKFWKNHIFVVTHAKYGISGKFVGSDAKFSFDREDVMLVTPLVEAIYGN